MMEVLSEYEEPYNPREPRLNLDEKLWQLLETPRGQQPVKPGRVLREDYEYKRKGTANVFVCVEPKTGERHHRVTSRRCRPDFAKFVRYLVMQAYQDARLVHITVDNLNTHNDKSILERYGEGEGSRICKRIKWHYTPKHASWLNAAEIEIAVVTSSMKRLRIASKDELTKHVRAIQRRRNKQKAKINWKFTMEDAKKKFDLHNY